MKFHLCFGSLVKSIVYRSFKLEEVSEVVGAAVSWIGQDINDIKQITGFIANVKVKGYVGNMQKDNVTHHKVKTSQNIKRKGGKHAKIL